MYFTNKKKFGGLFFFFKNLNMYVGIWGKKKKKKEIHPIQLTFHKVTKDFQK